MSFLQDHGALQQTVKKSAEVSASNHSLTIPESDIDDLLDGVTEFSISFWFKPSTGALTSNGNIFSSLNTNSGNDGWALEIETTTELRVWAIDNFPADDYLLASFTHTMTDNNWYHIVLTYDGSTNVSGVNLYIDGVSRPRTSINDTLGDVFGGVIEAQTDLQFGNGNFFGGACLAKYSDITLWETELSSGQVSTLYNSGTPDNPRTQLPSEPLRAWFRIDEDEIFYPDAYDSQQNLDLSYDNIPVTNITDDVP